MTKKFSLGIDFGSNSARALIIDVETGEEYGVGTSVYPGGDQGVYTSTTNPHVARQDPMSYVKSLEEATTEAVQQANERSDYSSDNLIGIGVDTTGSTPIPVTADMTPVSELKSPTWRRSSMESRSRM